MTSSLQTLLLLFKTLQSDNNTTDVWYTHREEIGTMYQLLLFNDKIKFKQQVWIRTVLWHVNCVVGGCEWRSNESFILSFNWDEDFCNQFLKQALFSQRSSWLNISVWHLYSSMKNNLKDFDLQFPRRFFRYIKIMCYNLSLVLLFFRSVFFIETKGSWSKCKISIANAWLRYFVSFFKKYLNLWFERFPSSNLKSVRTLGIYHWNDITIFLPWIKKFDRCQVINDSS